MKSRVLWRWYTGDVIGVRISPADEDDEVEPWRIPPSGRRARKHIDGPLPERVEIVRSNLLYIDRKNLPPAMLNRLLRLTGFQNPEFYKAQAMRLSTFGKPRIISCGQDFAQYVALPRDWRPYRLPEMSTAAIVKP